MKYMSFRSFFSNTIESGSVSDFKTRTYNIPTAIFKKDLEEVLSVGKGFTLIHKSTEYGEYMFNHKFGQVTLTVGGATSLESTVGMYVVTKKRFGFPKKWGKSIYTLIDKEIAHK